MGTGKINTDLLKIGGSYTRNELAELWGYQDYHPIGRGIFTNNESNKIILFVTSKKTSDRVQYKDNLIDGTLYMEGSKGHSSDDRIISNLNVQKDEFHLFFRDNKDVPFVYYGQCFLSEFKKNSNTPSSFVFKLKKIAVVISSVNDLADYVASTSNFDEGAIEGLKKLSTHFRYERNPKNRRLAIQYHGHVCKICGFDFNEFYGKDLANDFIEIHHIKMVSTGEQRPDPKKDLIPVCSNCHSMLHRNKNNPISIEQLKKLIKLKSKVK